MVARLASDGGENTSYSYLAVCLHCDGKRGAVRLRVERIRHSSRGIEPGDADATLSTDKFETSARQDFAVRLHHDAVYIEVRIRVEGISHAIRAVDPAHMIARVPPDVGALAAQLNFPVCLHSDRTDKRKETGHVRIESCVERAIGIQAGDVAAGHAQNAAKEATNEKLPVRLNGGGINTPSLADYADHVEIGRPIDSAVGLHSRDVVASDGRASHRRQLEKNSAQQNPAVWLHRDGTDLTARLRVEGISQSGDGIESRDKRTRLHSDARETAAHQNHAIRLDRYVDDNTGRIRIE